MAIVLPTIWPALAAVVGLIVVRVYLVLRVLTLGAKDPIAELTGARLVQGLAHGIRAFRVMP